MSYFVSWYVKCSFLISQVTSTQVFFFSGNTFNSRSCTGDRTDEHSGVRGGQDTRWGLIKVGFGCSEKLAVLAWLLSAGQMSATEGNTVFEMPNKLIIHFKNPLHLWTIWLIDFIIIQEYVTKINTCTGPWWSQGLGTDHEPQHPQFASDLCKISFLMSYSSVPLIILHC